MKAVRTMSPAEEQEWAREMAAPEIPDRQHTAAMLHAGGVTYIAIAEVMDIDAGSVRNMVAVHSVARCRFCRAPEEEA